MPGFIWVADDEGGDRVEVVPVCLQGVQGRLSGCAVGEKGATRCWAFGICARQWNGPVFSPLTETVDVGSGTENDVVAVESGQFGDAQAGLHRQQQQGAVSAPFPAAGVGSVDERVDLGGGEKRDELLVEPFGRDRQDPLDQLGVFGVSQRRLSPVDDYPQWTGRRIRIPLQGRRLAL